MTTTRRGFLATIVAAIFWRKKPAQEYVTPWMAVDWGYDKSHTVIDTWERYPDGSYRCYVILKTRSVGMTTMIRSGQPLYWHGKLPFVTLNPAPLPWEKQPPFSTILPI